MSGTGVWRLTLAIGLSVLQLHAALAAPATRESLEIRAFVNDQCIVADEPFFVPASANANAPEQMTPKFLPLLGIVVGKLAELFINHEIQASANRIRSGAERKDTRYALTREMNLYRVDFQPAPVAHLNAKLGCMTIVAASFLPETADCTSAYIPKELARETEDLPPEEWKSSRSDGSIENQLRRANICVDGKAHALYEARFEFSKDGTAYRLRDAGYRIDSLLTTTAKGASRSALYTLKISQPGATEQQLPLTSAWVNLGSVRAGTESSGSADDAAPWLRVPPMTTEARRAFDEQTKTQQEVAGQIGALQRAATRNQRLLAGLDRRIADATPEVAAGLQQERTRVAVQMQAQAAELDAQTAEYADLPRAPLEFMPVTIEVAVTETESEKKAQLLLADVIGSNGGLLASAAAGAASGLLSRSLSVSGLNTARDQSDLDLEMADARAQYFDALVDARAATPGAASEGAIIALAAARAKYNNARHLLGLEPIR